MANVKKCDRCGETIPEKKYSIFARRFYYGGCVIEDMFNFLDFDSDYDRKKYELCKKCSMELLDFLKPIDRKKVD